MACLEDDTMGLWLALMACQGAGDDAVPKEDGSVGSTGETGTEVGVPLAITVDPAWVRNEDGARLLGTVTVSTNVVSTVQIEVDDGGRSWVHENSDLATDHEVQVLGLLSGATHTFVVTVTDATGIRVIADPFTFTPDPLPADFPTFTVDSQPERMEPGVTMLTMGAYMVLVDPHGEIRWYLPTTGSSQLVGITERDTLFVFQGKGQLQEVSLTGAVVRQFRAARREDGPNEALPVDIEAFHHDVIELPNGNLLALSVERRLVDDYPTSGSDALAPPADAFVAGDVVVEFQPDGTLVHEWPMLDVLDPTRIGYDSLSNGHWEAFYGGEQALDWSHGNALWFDEARDEVLVSLRHQDAVVALAHGTGEIAWIFAPLANWKAPWAAKVLRPATTGLLPAYHQHGVKLTSDGALMMFDNGNNRASAFEPQLPQSLATSRGIEFEIDPDGGTWDITWQVGPGFDPTLYAGSLGDADPMPQTGNMLVTFGTVSAPDQDAAQIFEATNTDPPEVVFHLSLQRPYIVARSERLCCVIPGF